MNMFRRAGTAEILRSHQKDDFYLSYLRSSLADVAQTVVGTSVCRVITIFSFLSYFRYLLWPSLGMDIWTKRIRLVRKLYISFHRARKWMQWRKELDVLADVGYFVLTTFSGFQTVGEEYVNIIQTDKTLRSLPSKWRRVLMVLLQVVAPYALRRSLETLEKTLRSSSLPNMSARTRDRLLELVPTLRHVLMVLHRCHLATFYLEGLFYHLAKRLTGIHYVQYMARNIEQSSDPTFRILGWVSLLQLTGSLALQLFCLWRKQSSAASGVTENIPVDAVSGVVAPDRKCSLCLEGRKFSTVTPCGHLFCWNCIHEWCQTKAECPLCRDRCPPHRLVFLKNYDTS